MPSEPPAPPARPDDAEQAPQHELWPAPYVGARPVADPRQREAYVGIAGEVPSAIHPPSGCRFNTRCPIAIDVCTREVPALLDVGDAHHVACHRSAEHIDVTTKPAPDVA